MTETATPTSPLPTARREQLAGWALSERRSAYVWRPTTIEEILEVFALARQIGTTVALRGAGNSYNDASLNRDAIVLDLTGMRRILEWHPETGVIRVEAGVTIGDIWRRCLPDGWWPAVVPGTQTPTVGGCLAMNVHGKNAWKLGSFGEHVLEIAVLTPNGDLLTLTPEGDPDLFHAVVGGLGMLGVVTSATLQLRRVAAGTLLSTQHVTRNLREMCAIYEDLSPRADYLVGWIDGFAHGESAGRGLVQRAQLDIVPHQVSLSQPFQDPPARIAGVFPRAEAWRLMKPIFNDPGMHLVNRAQFMAGMWRSQREPLRVPFAQYHFFHDYLPGWRKVALPYGMRQFQVFAPADTAYDLFADLLSRTHHAGIAPYLVTFKRHRADQSLLSYQVDGYSLSLDYLITSRNRERLATLLGQMREQALAAHARFYMAKDDLLTAHDFRRSVGDAAMDTFLTLKARLDPEGMLSSDLFRRIS
jgi:decaprenylphospho-beta-D-ribofuranose 2-oxidase